MRHRFRTLVALAVAAGLMLFFLRNVELARVADAIGSADRELLLGALVLAGVGYVIRAVRWLVLLAPIGTVGFGAAWRATMIGFAVTAVLPGRMGEVLRPYLLARRERLSATAVFATVVVERMLDLVAILLIFGASVLVLDPAFAVADEALLYATRAGAVAAAGTAVAALWLAHAAAGRPDHVRRFAEWGTRPFSPRVSAVVVDAAERFVDGLAVMRQWGPLFGATAWSLALWLTIAAGLWSVTKAFGVGMAAGGSGVLLVLVALGVAVPTPAGIGGYHAAYQVGVTALYAASDEAAVGGGLVAHAVAFVPVTIMGIMLMAHEGVQLGRLTDVMTEDAEDAAGVAVPPPSSVRDEGGVG